MSPSTLSGRKVVVRVVREPAWLPITPRRRSICWEFGLATREEPFAITEEIAFDLAPGSITLITGPSGSGKTSLLNALAGRVETVRWVAPSRLPANRAIVDAVAPRRRLGAALEVLIACGLGEPKVWLRCGADLSDGERFRAALARAIGAARGARQDAPILCDEFSANLHRRLARAIACNLRKLITRTRLTLILASTHDDILADLRPDRIIRLGEHAAPQQGNTAPAGANSLRDELVIEPGGIADYHDFAPMHYRQRDGLGFVDKIFRLLGRRAEGPLGVLVYAHAPLELALRNHCTGGRFIRNPRRLNRELRILRRLIIHPDIRGCGFGHWFVRQTLPRVGVRFVECLAALGSLIPVFEKAGMTRVGRCPVPRGRVALLERLRKWKLDPFADDFSDRIGANPRVRALLERTVEDWMNIMHGTRLHTAVDCSPSDLARRFRQLIAEPPVYYLWDRDREFPLRAPVESVAPANPAHRRARPRSRDRHDPR